KSAVNYYLEFDGVYMNSTVYVNDYVLNVGSKPKATVGNIELESDKIDGYVEYGIGVNKDFIGTVWSCYAQVTGRGGDRSGFSGNLGVRYKF
ncbi:MAG: hypothetical protein IKN42_00230, partial [Elusimicrobia bacterium]|nr:hypothetical protein [Elusimicrobiota bacterium]